MSLPPAQLHLLSDFSLTISSIGLRVSDLSRICSYR